MNISRKALKHLASQVNIETPKATTFQLPDKILQFGTGVLLRGLPDYFVNQANREKVFNGRIVVVKSTDRGSTKPFSEQDGLYTVCIQGIENGKIIENYYLNNSISQVLNAKQEWDKVLKFATSEEMQIVISNTTEVGIRPSTDNIFDSPPPTYPGKLLAFLHARYQAFNGASDKGLVIIPTELIENNGNVLKDILINLANKNKLKQDFIIWLNTKNYFCNSLVDRIVPGDPGEKDKNNIEQKLGYQDNLMICAEPYRLWAIEYPEEKVKNILSFANTDEGIVLAKDISKQRELKLRLLNGTHTFSCALAYLSGFHTVKEALDNDEFNDYMRSLMFNEIIPAITNESISKVEAINFADKVLDRFRNPFIIHKWLNISMEYTTKMKMRNIPLLLDHYKKSDIPPPAMARGLAAYILFMHSKKVKDNTFYGSHNGEDYLINDKHADILHKWWEKYPQSPVNAILSDTQLWNTDLTLLPGLANEVEKQLLFNIEMPA